MRILELTDDVRIDRRIVQRAQAFAAAGHEIIILAGSSNIDARFDWIGPIKIERVDFDLSASKHLNEFALGMAFWPIRIFSLTAQIVTAIHVVVQRASNLTTPKIQYRSPQSEAARDFGNAFDLTDTSHSDAGSTNTLFRRVGFHGKLRLFPSLRHAWHVLPLPVRVRFWQIRAQLRQTLSPAFRIARWFCRGSMLSKYHRVLIQHILFYRPDLIIANDLPQLPLASHAKSMALKRLGYIPMIYDAHELYPEIHTLNSYQAKALSKMEKKFIKTADLVVTVNPYIAKELTQRYKIKNPLVIFNSVSPPVNFDPRKNYDLFRKELKIPQDHKILLYQGWMSEHRGLQMLTRALRDTPSNIHLVFMGYGEVQRTLEHIARAEGLLNRVHFKSAVSQVELLYWTSSADAGIIPYQPIDLNNYYSSPNKLFEFIEAGLPIIANDLPFLRSIVFDEGFGLVKEFTDECAVAAVITEMFDSSLGGAARFRSVILEKKQKFSWENENLKLFNAMEQLALPPR